MASAASPAGRSGWNSGIGSGSAPQPAASSAPSSAPAGGSASASAGRSGRVSGSGSGSAPQPAASSAPSPAAAGGLGQVLGNGSASAPQVSAAKDLASARMAAASSGGSGRCVASRRASRRTGSKPPPVHAHSAEGSRIAPGIMRTQASKRPATALARAAPSRSATASSASKASVMFSVPSVDLARSRRCARVRMTGRSGSAPCSSWKLRESMIQHSRVNVVWSISGSATGASLWWAAAHSGCLRSWQNWQIGAIRPPGPGPCSSKWSISMRFGRCAPQ